MKGPIQSIEVTYFLHATEDPDRVSAAVLGLLGTTIPPEVERLEGHFGNEIVKARLHLIGTDAEEAFAKVISKMPRSMKEEVISGLGDYVDEHSALFLRLDKQRLVSGSMELGSRDAVRLKVKPRIFMKGRAERIYAELMGGA